MPFENQEILPIIRPCQEIANYTSRSIRGKGDKSAQRRNLRKIKRSVLIKKWTKYQQKKTVELYGSEEPYLKPVQLARVLNVKSETIIDWCRRHPDLPHLQLPGSIRIRKSDFEACFRNFNQPMQFK